MKDSQALGLRAAGSVSEGLQPGSAKPICGFPGPDLTAAGGVHRPACRTRGTGAHPRPLVTGHCAPQSTCCPEKPGCFHHRWPLAFLSSEWTRAEFGSCIRTCPGRQPRGQGPPGPGGRDSCTGGAPPRVQFQVLQHPLHLSKPHVIILINKSPLSLPGQGTHWRSPSELVPDT